MHPLRLERASPYSPSALFRAASLMLLLALAGSLSAACGESTPDRSPTNSSDDDDDTGDDGPGDDDDAPAAKPARDAGTADAASGSRSDAGANPRQDAAATRSDAGNPGVDQGERDAASRGDAQTTAPQDDASTAPGGGAPTGQCGDGAPKLTPFGCKFAWGTNAPESPVPGLEELGFITKWIGYEVDKTGTIARCDGCSWLTSEFGDTAALPVYYAYFIGFFGSANGFMDQNVNPNGPNLATDGAKLIRDHRAAIIEMYASYAKQSAKVWPDKPLVWLLEGDFVQYTYKEQKSALTMPELAALARDITCAIRSNMPNAVVAINHTTWLSNEVTNQFWEEMERAGVAYDLVWTTGVANNNGLLESGGKPDSYNAATATYAYVSKKTGRKIFVDTSFGLSAMQDTWSAANAETLNARIAEGVIAANVATVPANYVSTVKALTEKLDPVCE